MEVKNMQMMNKKQEEETEHPAEKHKVIWRSMGRCREDKCEVKIL